MLTGVDNVTVARSGDVYVAEDGGNMELVLLSPDGGVAPFLRCTASGSELTGPAFDPSGTRLYLSSQRNPGRTFEVRGPFRTSTAPPSSSTTTTAAPGISLTAVGSKAKGRKQVDLQWTGATGNTVRVLRDGALLVETANDGAHLDSIASKGGGTYTYRVCAADGSVCSNTATVTF